MPSRRTFLFATALVVLLVPAWRNALADAEKNAGEFISMLGNRAVEVLSNKDDSSFEEREALFRDLLVEGFDMPTIGRFVLGRHWRSATEQQREDYSAVFTDFIVRVYASRFDSYSGEMFEVNQVVSDDNGDMIVRSKILRPSGSEAVGVDFRVRKLREALKVVDVNVEGISMLHTHRVEFSSVIKRKGMDGLLAELRSRAAPSGETAVN